jgi:predicted nucleic acid-binding protein
MQLVADTNVLVAALLRKGDTRKLLFSKKFEIFSPDRVITEILDHKQEFMQKGSMLEQEFQQALELELENVTVTPIEEYGQLKQKALVLCPKGHEKDWPFIALALKLDCPLWSNDSALKRQTGVQAFSTTDLLKKIE